MPNTIALGELHGRRKVFVGLSGGVDSAVSAALLKEAGADVTGVFIKGWYPRDMPCTWAEERRDAMRVAARLKIHFQTLDAGVLYKREVIDYLLSEYSVGRTPNPDVMCNREIKFGAFYRYAMSSGADAIATGHYRGGEKDQTYFLWAVPKDILRNTIFPVGNYNKDHVRALARKFNLPVYEKKDSQGICFLGSVSVKEFLEKEFGNDNPAILYTIGQRMASPNGPWYVVDKNVEKKEIVVSRSRNARVFGIDFTSANWHLDSSEANTAQCRYRGPRITGYVEKNRFVNTISLPDLRVPGQSIVFYKNDELVGGGIIK